MDTLVTAMNALAAQVAANYNAFMGIQHMDAIIFMLAGGALVGVVPYATKKYSGRIDAPPPVSPSDYDTVEDEQQALNDILSNAEVSVPLPSAPNVPIPSIWGHPNTVHYTPSEPWNQALTLRTRVPPAQASPLASLGLLVIGVFIVSVLAWFVRRCCCGRRNHVAAAPAADDNLPTEIPVNTPSNQKSAADASNNQPTNGHVPTTRLAEANITPSSVASLRQRLQELSNVNGTLTTQIRDTQKRTNTAVAEAQDALCHKEMVEAQNEYLAQQLDSSQNELASLRSQLVETNKRISDSQSATSAFSECETKLQANSILQGQADQLPKPSTGQENKGMQFVVPPASHSRSLSTTSETPSLDSLYTNEHGNYLPTQPARVISGQSGISVLEQYHRKNLQDQQDLVQELQQRLNVLNQAKAKEVDRMTKEASDLHQQLNDTEQRLGDCEASRTALQQQLQLQGDLQGYNTEDRVEQLQQQVEELEKELETKTQSIDEYSQKVGTQQDEYNVLYAQLKRYRIHVEAENSALSEAKEREDQLEDNLRMAENEIDVLKDRMKELELSGGTQQQLRNAKAELETVRSNLKNEQGKLDDSKTKRKQQVGDAQYTKALEQQLADLRLQLEAGTTHASESAPDKALKFELADLHYELEQKDRTMSDLEKQIDKWQKQAQATEGEAAYDDIRTRSELTDQVESQAHTIEKLREQVKELEGRFLAAEGEASIDDLRKRTTEDSRTICTLRAELKRLKARMQHANVEPVTSTTVVPAVVSPVPPNFPPNAVQTSNGSVNARTNPQQEQRTALARSTAISLPNNTPKNRGPAVIDASLTRTPTPATPKTPSLLGGSRYASWKCSFCRCSFSGGKVDQTTHEDLCRKWHEDHVSKRDMTLDTEHPPNWENAGPLDADATKAEWMSLVMDKQKQQQSSGPQVTETGSTLPPTTTQGLQKSLKADALDFTPKRASTSDAKVKSENPDVSKAAEENEIAITPENPVEAAQATEVTSGEDQSAAIVGSNDTAPEHDAVEDDGSEGGEDSTSESTDSSLDFDLGDQSTDADARKRTMRSASGGEGEVVGYINNGVIPVYATEVNKYLNNPEHDFKWARGKGPKKETETKREGTKKTEGKETGNQIKEQTEQKAEETEQGTGEDAVRAGRNTSETSPAIISQTSRPAEAANDHGASSGHTSGAADASLAATMPKSRSSSPSILLNEELGTGATQRSAQITDSPSAPAQDLATSSVSKAEGGEDTNDPQRPSSASNTVPAGAAETDMGTPSQQDPSSSEKTKTAETSAGRIASTPDRSAVTPAPSNRDLNTFKLPLRSSPEDPLPGRQAMRGNRPAGPKLDLTKPSVQRNISSVLNTPGMVRNNSKVSPSLGGSRYARGSPDQPAMTPGPSNPSSVNSSILSHRTSLPTSRTPRSTSGQRHLSAGTPNAPTNAPTGPTGKNTCKMCSATFTDTENPKWSFRQNHLPKCRAWKTEWEPQSYAKKTGDPSFPPQWKNERTQRPAVDPDWLVMAKEVQSQRDDKMKRAFFADGTPGAAAAVTTDRKSEADAGKQSKGAIKESITEEEGEAVRQTASVKATKDTASNGDVEDKAKESRSKQQPERSSDDTKSSGSTKPASPFNWEHDEEDGDAAYRVPSWAAESQDAGHQQSAVRTNDNKHEQGDSSVPNDKSQQGKGDMKQAGPSSSHDAAALPTSSPTFALTPSRIPAPASATLAAAATVTPGRNQVLVDVPLSTPTFVPNSGRLSGGGLGGSRWATATPKEGSSTPSPGPRSQNLQRTTIGRGGRQVSNKRKGRGGYGGGKKQ